MINAIKNLLAALSALALLCNLSIITIIAKCHKLHKIRYYIVVNLAVADALLVCIVLTQHLASMNDVYELEVAYMIVALSSLSCVLALSFDRYIAVIHCLRYHTLVTTKRLQVFLLSSWIGSIVLGFLPVALTSDMWRRLVISYCIYTPINCAGSVFLVFSAIWVKMLRDKHERAIKEQNLYFGIHDDSLTKLKEIKASVVSLTKLNIPTAGAIIMSTAARLIHIYVYERHSSAYLYIKVGTRLIYVFLNPVIYIISMGSLKQEYVNVAIYVTKRIRTFFSDLRRTYEPATITRTI